MGPHLPLSLLQKNWNSRPSLVLQELFLDPGLQRCGRVYLRVSCSKAVRSSLFVVPLPPSVAMAAHQPRTHAQLAVALRSQRDKDYHRNAESKPINFWCAPDMSGPQKRNFRSG